VWLSGFNDEPDLVVLHFNRAHSLSKQSGLLSELFLLLLQPPNIPLLPVLLISHDFQLLLQFVKLVRQFQSLLGQDLCALCLVR
jgi:hypothetical protein